MRGVKRSDNQLMRESVKNIQKIIIKHDKAIAKQCAAEDELCELLKDVKLSLKENQASALQDLVDQYEEDHRESASEISEIEKKNYKMSAKKYWREQAEEVKERSQKAKNARIRLEYGGSLHETPNVGPGGDDEVIRSRSVELEKYKQKVKNWAFKGNLKRELTAINILLENDEEVYTRGDWSYLYKRWKKVYGRINNPTARFIAMGAVPGRIPGAMQYEVALLESIQNIKTLVKKELENAKQSNFV